MNLDAFLGWFEKSNPQQQIKAINNLVASHYVDKPATSGRALLMDPAEAEAALVALLDAPSMDLRLVLAQLVAPLTKAPEALILGLAQDCDIVASVIYRYSPLLLEAELMARLGNASCQVEVAIAERPNLSGRVVERIVQTASDAACVALAGNTLSAISGPFLLTILARLGPTSALRQALLRSGRLYDPAVGPAQGEAAGRDDEPSFSAVDAGSAEQALAEQTTLALLRTCGADEIGAAVAQLIETQKVTTTLLLRALIQSDLEFLVNAYAQLARLPLKRVFALMGTSRALGYSALHQKSSLPPSTKTIFSIGLDVQADAMRRDWANKPHQDLLICEEMLRRYVATNPDQSDDVFIFLRTMKVELARRNARARLLCHTKRVEPLAAPPLLLEGPEPSLAAGSTAARAPARRHQAPDDQRMEKALLRALERELVVDDGAAGQSGQKAPPVMPSPVMPSPMMPSLGKPSSVTAKDAALNVSDDKAARAAEARAQATLARLKKREGERASPNLRASSDSSAFPHFPASAKPSASPNVRAKAPQIATPNAANAAAANPAALNATRPMSARTQLSGHALDAMALELEAELKAQKAGRPAGHQSAA